MSSIRIRHHLYAKFPAQSKDRIRESILKYPAYATEQYDFEFQRMIRVAVERFGASLIANDDLVQIFETIINGPDKDDYRQFMGEQFTEEGYRRRQDYFQLRQFRPFASILFGRYKERSESLAASAPTLTDENFVRYGAGEAKSIVSRSPKTVAELAQLTDDALISFLNTWEEAERDSEEWWVEIDFTGLAVGFQQLIAANPNRFLNWGDQWKRLERPIYLRYALDAAGKRIAEHQSELPQWLEIADWIMSQAAGLRGTTDKTSETSRKHPDWSGAQRQVIDFIGVCVNKDVNVSPEWRPQIFALLKAACLAADSSLDTNAPVVTPRDYLTDAINTTRGRALENLLQYGSWVLRHTPAAEHSDLFAVIELRLNGKPPLALAEYALLGLSFHKLYGFSSSWAKENVSRVFPQSALDAWAIAFGTYVRFNNAHPVVFEMLKPQLDFAVEHLRSLEDKDHPRSDAVAHLGYHLLDYFLWGLIDLSGNDSLLRKFYVKTQPEYWAELFDHLGRLLSGTSALNPEIAERCKAFFEARLAESNIEELQEFTFWFKAECLPPAWRLTAFMQTLDVTKTTTTAASMLTEELAKLLKDEPDLVVSAFAKLTEGLLGRPYFYVQPEYVKRILKHGFSSKREATVQAAKLAQDNLLKAGRSEFRNLNTIEDNVKWT
jgi:hypothetical protein